jgi:hypothetical protein
LQAKIVAYNIYGDSVESDVGTGNIITTKPDTPINFIENTALRTASSLALKWEPGSSNGGTPLIYYRITYD